MPLEFPDGTTPVACRVCIYDGSMGKKVGVGSLMDKAIVPPLPIGSLYMEEVHVKVCILTLSWCIVFEFYKLYFWTFMCNVSIISSIPQTQNWSYSHFLVFSTFMIFLCLLHALFSWEKNYGFLLVINIYLLVHPHRYLFCTFIHCWTRFESFALYLGVIWC